MTTRFPPACQLPPQHLHTCQLNHRLLLLPRALVPPGSRRLTFTLAATARGIETEEKKDGGLKKGIAEFYDESSGIWEDIWGDHMHHGFYDPGSTVSVSDHRAAQIRMIDEALRFAGLSGQFLSLTVHFLVRPFHAFSMRIYVLVLRFVDEDELSAACFFFCFAEDPTGRPKSVVDVGCGIGGSSRYLARKFGSKCLGITLSPVQAQRANALAAAQGLADRVNRNFLIS